MNHDARNARHLGPLRIEFVVVPARIALQEAFPGTFSRAEASNPVMTGCHDDLTLVEACRAGQTEAFGILVRRYQDRLYSTILHLTGSPEDAQDVLQDAFIRAFEKLESVSRRKFFLHLDLPDRGQSRALRPSQAKGAPATPQNGFWQEPAGGRARGSVARDRSLVRAGAG